MHSYETGIRIKFVNFSSYFYEKLNFVHFYLVLKQRNYETGNIDIVELYKKKIIQIARASSF